MKFAQFIRILRAHAALILSAMAIAVITAMAATMLTPHRYEATSSVLVSGSTGSPISGNTLSPQLYSGYLATQLDVLTSRTVAGKVVDRLQLEGDVARQQRFLPTVESLTDRVRGEASGALGKILSFARVNDVDEEFADTAQGQQDAKQNARYQLIDRLLKQVSVRPSADSSVIYVSYAAATPRSAAEAANAWVNAYLDTHLGLTVDPAKQSTEWLERQITTLTANLQVAQQQLADYQMSTGIVGNDQTSDVESARLNDLSSQLVAAQAQNHPAIQSLKQDLSRAEEKLAGLPPQLGRNHPQYQKALADVTALRATLARETEALTAELRRQIASQKSLLLENRKQWGRLASLQDAVANAQKSLDDATQRATQSTMESRLNRTNVSILDLASPPRRPASPNALFNLLLGFALGSIIGVGLALWREVSCRYVRGMDDLRELLGIPVLGVLHDGGRKRLQSLRVRSRTPRLVDLPER